jgi:putative ABC transport system permease protein
MLATIALSLLAVAAAQDSVVPGSRAPLDVAIERRLATDLALEVGDTVRIGTAPDSLRTLVRVAAIYEPAPDPATVLRREYRLRFHLPDLAALLGAPDRVDRFGVALEPGVPADSVAASLNRTAFGYRAYPSTAIASESSQTFRVVSRFHRAIAVITIVASAVFLLCIMLLKVEERRLDAAVMRFVGVRRRTIFLALLLEAAVVAVLGSLLGVGIAWASSLATNAWYQHFFRTSLVFSLVTPGIVRFSVLLSLALGLGAGALAAWRLVRTRPMVLWGRG